MMSSKVAKLVHQVQFASNSLSIYVTSCIVTAFPIGQTLVNPSNEQLTGVSSFTYFPRGGPIPKQVTSMHKDWQPLGYVSNWGGMEVGNGMMYPVQVIDGLVHLHGGMSLQTACQWERLKASKPCPIGSAIATTAGNLRYDRVIHTTPPFYKHDHPLKLTECYRSVFGLLKDRESVAIPLLGAGCRGFPVEEAMQVAVESVIEWASQTRLQGVSLNFALLRDDDAKAMKTILLERQ